MRFLIRVGECMVHLDIHEADYVLLLRDSGVYLCGYFAVCEVELLKLVLGNRNPTFIENKKRCQRQYI